MDSVWIELKAAYFAGGEIRALARGADIPEGTALARAKRENWSSDRGKAREAASRDFAKADVSKAIALDREERRRRHLSRMEEITERIGTHVEDLPSDVALNRIGQLDRFDRLTRRTLGLEDGSSPAPLINVNLLSEIGAMTLNGRYAETSDAPLPRKIKREPKGLSDG